MNLAGDETESYTETCSACRRYFRGPGAYQNHLRKCQLTKKRLHRTLTAARDIVVRKRQRKEDAASGSTAKPTTTVCSDFQHLTSGQFDIRFQSSEIPVSLNVAHAPSIEEPYSVTLSTVTNATFDEDHLSMPIAERKSRRLRILSKRFRDDIPRPLAQCPPPSADLANLPPETRPAHEQSTLDEDASHPSTTDQCATPVRILEYFRTPMNAFRLFRRYLARSPPSHDPEESVEFSDLCNGHGESDALDDWSNTVEPMEVKHSTPSLKVSFGPYPNRSSFLLGEWYWNGGRQKSLEDFRSLLNVIGSPDFHSEDIRNTSWRTIDAQLGMNNFDGMDSRGDDDEWLDDGGWKKSNITISVPFHKRAKHPGAKDFFVGFLYHRSLTAVIKERLSNTDDTRFFHYDPFELLWQPQAGEKIRVHGELYTSPAFLEVHQELQESLNEPNCDLQKVVIALMFLSDTTHLTQFGTAKLWPAYLMFGNHSKYRRCKPSCNLCHHIAYFQGVSFPITRYFFGMSLTNPLSFLTALKISQQSTWARGLARL